MASSITLPLNTIVPSVVIITEDADMTLRVVEHDLSPRAGRGRADKAKTITDFRVNSQVMVRSSAYFEALLTGGLAEQGRSTIVLYKHKALAVQAILCAVHSKYDDWSSSQSGMSITKITLDLPCAYLWDIISSARDFVIESVQLDAWFKLWYGTNARKTDTKSLLYPCFRFNHAAGFLEATKSMVYDFKRIEETMIRGHHDLHLPPRVIQQMWGARSRLKVIIANELWRPIGSLLRASCDCKEKTLFAYQYALVATNAYPVDQASQTQSMTKVLVNLADFKNHSEPLRTQGCRECRRDWVSVVEHARSMSLGHFDGLCLDCMDYTQPKFGDRHEDYWRYVTHGMQWDKHCRVKHGETTWYRSFMGRYDDRKDLLKRRSFN